MPKMPKMPAQQAKPMQPAKPIKPAQLSLDPLIAAFAYAHSLSLGFFDRFVKLNDEKQTVAWIDGKKVYWADALYKEIVAPIFSEFMNADAHNWRHSTKKEFDAALNMEQRRYEAIGPRRLAQIEIEKQQEIERERLKKQRKEMKKQRRISDKAIDKQG